MLPDRYHQQNQLFSIQDTRIPASAYGVNFLPLSYAHFNHKLHDGNIASSNHI